MPRRERRRVVRDARSARQKVIDYLARHPGATAEDVASGTRLRMTQVTPRLSDLVLDGVLLRDGKGRNRAGNPVARYRSTGDPGLVPEDDRHRRNRPRCVTCGRVVRQSDAKEAADAIGNA